MRTYSEVQRLYYSKYKRTIKTCWIADVKRKLGLTTRVAANRINKTKVKYPCHPDDFEKIKKIVLG